MKVRMIGMVAGALLLSAATSQAFLGFGKGKDKTESGEQKDAARRYHMMIPDRETEVQLMTLLRQKQLLAEDARVLNRVLKTRMSLLEQLDRAIAKEFEIDPQARYRLDDEALTLYRQVEGGGEGEPIVLASEARMKRFRALYEQQLKLRIEVKILDRVLREQESSAREVERLLASKFDIQRDRYYYYDAPYRTLYEIEQPPQSNRSVPAP